jgi:hypothetical protein
MRLGATLGQHREISYDGLHCNLTIQQFAPAVVVLRISGSDVGEFGDAPMKTLDEWLDGSDGTKFFIDARDVRGVTMDVSGDWARWLSAHKDQLSAVTMITGSSFIQLTAEFVRRFADLQGIMRICTEAPVFESALAEALQPQ